MAKTPARHEGDTAIHLGVAIELSVEAPPFADTLQNLLVRTRPVLPGARLACLNILKQERITLDQTLDAGQNIYHQRLVELQSWAVPLELDEGRITFHVLESTDPASAILQCMHANHMDHLVVGARASSLRRTCLSSVSSQVAAQAPCTITVAQSRRLSKASNDADAGDEPDVLWTVD